MQSVIQMLEWINGENSPVELYDNESFSLPFTALYDGELHFVLFAYSVPLFPGSDTGSVCLSDVFYINPNDFADFKTVSVNAEAPAEITELFGNAVFVPPPIDYPCFLQEILELTDKILSGDADAHIVRQYAERFRVLVPPEVNVWYTSYGADFFARLSEMLHE